MISEVVDSIRNNKRAEYERDILAHYDALYLENIEYLATAKATQEAFQFILDQFIESEKQVVLTSCLLPRLIPDVHQRLISRFEWGLVADITE